MKVKRIKGKRYTHNSDFAVPAMFRESYVASVGPGVVIFFNRPENNVSFVLACAQQWHDSPVYVHSRCVDSELTSSFLSSVDAVIHSSSLQRALQKGFYRGRMRLPRPLGSQ